MSRSSRSAAGSDYMSMLTSRYAGSTDESPSFKTSTSKSTSKVSGSVGGDMDSGRSNKPSMTVTGRDYMDMLGAKFRAAPNVDESAKENAPPRSTISLKSSTNDGTGSRASGKTVTGREYMDMLGAKFRVAQNEDASPKQSVTSRSTTSSRADTTDPTARISATGRDFMSVDGARYRVYSKTEESNEQSSPSRSTTSSRPNPNDPNARISATGRDFMSVDGARYRTYSKKDETSQSQQSSRGTTSAKDSNDPSARISTTGRDYMEVDGARYRTYSRKEEGGQQGASSKAKSASSVGGGGSGASADLRAYLPSLYKGSEATGAASSPQGAARDNKSVAANGPPAEKVPKKQTASSDVMNILTSRFKGPTTQEETPRQKPSQKSNAAPVMAVDSGVGAMSAQNTTATATATVNLSGMGPSGSGRQSDNKQSVSTPAMKQSSAVTTSDLMSLRTSRFSNAASEPEPAIQRPGGPTPLATVITSSIRKRSQDNTAIQNSVDVNVDKAKSSGAVSESDLMSLRTSRFKGISTEQEPPRGKPQPQVATSASANAQMARSAVNLNMSSGAPPTFPSPVATVATFSPTPVMASGVESSSEGDSYTAKSTFNFTLSSGTSPAPANQSSLPPNIKIIGKSGVSEVKAAPAVAKPVEPSHPRQNFTITSSTYSTSSAPPPAAPPPPPSAPMPVQQQDVSFSAASVKDRWVVDGSSSQNASPSNYKNIWASRYGSSTDEEEKSSKQTISSANKTPVETNASFTISSSSVESSRRTAENCQAKPAVATSRQTISSANKTPVETNASFSISSSVESSKRTADDSQPKPVVATSGVDLMSMYTSRFKGGMEEEVPRQRPPSKIVAPPATDAQFTVETKQSKSGATVEQATKKSSASSDVMNILTSRFKGPTTQEETPKQKPTTRTGSAASLPVPNKESVTVEEASTSKKTLQRKDSAGSDIMNMLSARFKGPTKEEETPKQKFVGRSSASPASSAPATDRATGVTVDDKSVAGVSQSKAGSDLMNILTSRFKGPTTVEEAPKQKRAQRSNTTPVLPVASAFVTEDMTSDKKTLTRKSSTGSDYMSMLTSRYASSVTEEEPSRQKPPSKGVAPQKPPTGASSDTTGKTSSSEYMSMLTSRYKVTDEEAPNQKLTSRSSASSTSFSASVEDVSGKGRKSSGSDVMNILTARFKGPTKEEEPPRQKVSQKTNAAPRSAPLPVMTQPVAVAQVTAVTTDNKQKPGASKAGSDLMSMYTSRFKNAEQVEEPPKQARPSGSSVTRSSGATPAVATDTGAHQAETKTTKTTMKLTLSSSPTSSAPTPPPGLPSSIKVIGSAGVKEDQSKENVYFNRSAPAANNYSYDGSNVDFGIQSNVSSAKTTTGSSGSDYMNLLSSRFNAVATEVEPPRQKASQESRKVQAVPSANNTSVSSQSVSTSFAGVQQNATIPADDKTKSSAITTSDLMSLRTSRFANAAAEAGPPKQTVSQTTTKSTSEDGGSKTITTKTTTTTTTKRYSNVSPADGDQQDSVDVNKAKSSAVSTSDLMSLRTSRFTNSASETEPPKQKPVPKQVSATENTSNQSTRSVMQVESPKQTYSTTTTTSYSSFSPTAVMLSDTSGPSTETKTAKTTLNLTLSSTPTSAPVQPAFPSNITIIGSSGVVNTGNTNSGPDASKQNYYFENTSFSTTPITIINQTGNVDGSGTSSQTVTRTVRSSETTEKVESSGGTPKGPASSGSDYMSLLTSRFKN